ncbi:helicase-associated domain-containing protein [Rhodococcus sp. HNM0569]|uniref:helicase-associated domain-containing protein n=1 Tax=Rhodococcus sp. HNM0569 TaxID=2716340 RepID=UPI00146F8787|nr:helicase-associated domain-containing protein [Rhodococcus sp. HNM0569]NLU82421.1 DNA-binding protein [Rhodococcus sp. HNM0569]
MTDTDSSSRASGTSPDGLPAWLSQRSDADLVTLLALRPDLAVPPPATMGVLAGRAEQRASVARAADELTTAHFALVEMLALAGAEREPVARTTLDTEVAQRVPKKQRPPKRDVGRLLDDLRARALVYGPQTALRTVPALVQTVPWRIGGRSHREDALDEAEIAAIVPSLSEAERKVLDTLAQSGSLGRTRDAAPGTAPDRPVQRLLAHHLLFQVDDETVELPHAVRQVLRGEPVFDPTSLTPPSLSTTHHDPADVNAAAAGEALEFLRHCTDVVSALGDAPAVVLRSGGLGVREIKRLAKSTRLDDDRVGLILEVLAAAGLVAAGVPDPAPSDSGDPYWAPTTAVDAWLSAPVPRQWFTLAQAWLDLPRQPWFVGRKDARTDKAVAALSEEVRAPSAPRDRRAVLDVLGELDSGTAAPADEIARLVSWRRPRWGARVGATSVGHMIREAAALGLVARGALGSPGRALLHGGDAEAQMQQALPEPVDHVLVQADLTIVAPGPLTGELLEQITLVADIESAGAASMYRVGEASLRRALDAGMTATELHSLFATRSRTPVPQSLTYLIDDVARRHGRLRVGVASAFVRSEDPALLSEVLAHPVADALALRALAPTVAVSQAPLREVLDELRGAGFAPAGEDSSGTLVDLRPKGARVLGRRGRQSPRGPSAPTSEQLEAMVRSVRAGDLAASVGGRGGIRTDGSRAGTAATVALLGKAARDGTQVAIGYVDAQGIASNRIVQPVQVGGGQLEAFDPGAGGIRRFTLHRVTSVSPVD